MEREHLRRDKIMGTTHLELLSKDLNYQFEGKKVYCRLHLIKIFKPSGSLKSK